MTWSSLGTIFSEATLIFKKSIKSPLTMSHNQEKYPFWFNKHSASTIWTKVVKMTLETAGNQRWRIQIYYKERESFMELHTGNDISDPENIGSIKTFSYWITEGKNNIQRHVCRCRIPLKWLFLNNLNEFLVHIIKWPSRFDDKR